MAKTRKKKGRGVIKTVFNPRGWMSYDEVKKSGEDVSRMVKAVTEERQPGRKETFEQAMTRMKLSEEDIQKRMQQLYLSSCIYAGVSCLIFIYAFVALIVFGGFWTWVAALIVSALGFALSFRDSFFYFQMKSRRLGCTIPDWIRFVTKRGSSHSKDLK